MHWILLILGFILLVKGADIFVDGASSIAQNFKVSKMLIGLTIVAFGTSAPELAVSIQAMLNGSGDIVIGNVIGSNILNILLILGVASIIYPITVKRATIKKEIPIMILITVLLSVVLMDNLFDSRGINTITRSDGIVLSLYFVIFIYYLFSVMRGKIDVDEDNKPKYNIPKSIMYTIVGIVSVVLGSHVVVDNAILIAYMFGVSERLISLTIVAFGTSLPELVTSVVAARKKESDIAIGNIIGSNMFNIGIVIAIPVMMLGNISSIDFNYIDLLVFVLSPILLWFLSRKGHRISRQAGILLLIIFVIYYSFVIGGSLI